MNEAEAIQREYYGRTAHLYDTVNVFEDNGDQSAPNEGTRSWA